MIRVSRPDPGAPTVLADRKGKGSTETARAIRFFRKRKRAASFPFEAYRDEAVKAALERLFRGKCAYCECRYVATQPVDVEHWRPKGAVEVEIVDAKGNRKVRKARGYYWLAAEWTNLLPSCIDCNRQRQQVLMPSGEVRLLGKGNRFPLRDERRRAVAPGPADLQGEEPLLLNPCTDEPALHLEHMGDAVFRAREESPGQPSRMGEISIEVYALNRTALVQERRELLLRIEQRAHTIQQLALLLGRKLPARERTLVEDLLSHEWNALLDFTDDSREFSFLAKHVVGEFVATLTSPGRAAFSVVPAVARARWAARS